MSVKALILALALFSNTLSATIRSMAVGTVKGDVLTSRDVQIQTYLDVALYRKESASDFKMPGLDSKAFSNLVGESLLQSAIAMEAQNFKVVQVSPEDLEKAKGSALKALKDVPGWKALDVTGKELSAAVLVKLEAKKFIQFRAQSSVLPVTDTEALKYFNENRLKFGDLPYENFKENIKSFLSRTQVDRRLKDWYEVLKNKYQVKNMLAEI